MVLLYLVARSILTLYVCGLVYLWPVCGYFRFTIFSVSIYFNSRFIFVFRRGNKFSSRLNQYGGDARTAASSAYARPTTCDSAVCVIFVAHSFRPTPEFRRPSIAMSQPSKKRKASASLLQAGLERVSDSPYPSPQTGLAEQKRLKSVTNSCDPVMSAWVPVEPPSSRHTAPAGQKKPKSVVSPGDYTTPKLKAR